MGPQTVIPELPVGAFKFFKYIYKSRIKWLFKTIVRIHKIHEMTTTLGQNTRMNATLLQRK